MVHPPTPLVIVTLYRADRFEVENFTRKTTDEFAKKERVISIFNKRLAILRISSTFRQQKIKITYNFIQKIKRTFFEPKGSG